MSSPCVYLLLILNIILPGSFLSSVGSGTMIASCYERPCSKTQFLLGALQLYTAFFIIGWVFSIYWGVLLFYKSRQPKPKPDYV